MDAKRIEEYHASRVLPDKAFRSSCYAPHVSMYFDTLGNVLACCQNTKYPVGNVQSERLPDIWNGSKIKKLRNALEKDRFGAGCQFCEWQISVGNYVNAFTRNFDRFPVASQNPDWPRMMEFSVSNTCNLECIMCIGTLSSSIRARREGLPPLPKAYSEQFFDDLRPFLKHLEFAKFLGGEPFLAAESFRIWDLMHEEKANILCNVTTNGTQWNERVERVLENFPISICISMDGTTPQTVESIRVNAKFDLVHENFKRFHRYCRERKTDITLTYCLMRQNWHEFGDYLLFADDWDCEVCVNLVREPAHCSLYTLPVEELSVIADELEKRSPTYLPKLKKNRKVWIEQLTAIRRRVEHSSESSRSPFATPLALVVLDRNPALDHPERMTFDKAKKRLVDSVGSQSPIVLFSADQDDRVQSFESADDTFFGVPAVDSSGQPFEEIVRQMVDRRGPQRTVPIYRTAEYVDRAVLFHRADGALDVLRVIAVPKLNEFGMPSGSVAAAAVTSLSAETLEQQEEEIRRLFADWGDAVLRIEMDPEGRIINTSGDADGGLGLLSKLRPGMNEAEFDRTLVETWGQKQQLHDEVRPDREMISNCHVRPSDTVVARMITRPWFGDGKHTGYVREIAYMTVDFARAQAITESAKKTLADWSGQSNLFRLHHNRADDATKFDGDAEVLRGVRADSLVGRQGWELPDVFSKHFGNGRVFRWHLNSERLDMQVKVPADQGFLLFRLIAVPTFNAGGHYQGRTRYITCWQRRESTLDTTRQELRSHFVNESNPVEWIELNFDQTDHCLGMTEPSTWLGIDPDSWRRMPLDGLEGRLDQRLGRKQLGLWEEKPGRIEIDRVFELPGRSARVRSIEIPTLEADGRCTGTTVLLAGIILDASIDWHRIHDEMREVQQMLNSWKTTEDVLSLGMDADGQVIRVRTEAGFCGLDESDLLGKTIDEVRAQTGFGPDLARRVWQAEPGQAIDQVDEVLVPSSSGGVKGRRLRRRHVPMYRRDLAVQSVEKLAIQEEEYS